MVLTKRTRRMVVDGLLLLAMIYGFWLLAWWLDPASMKAIGGGP